MFFDNLPLEITCSKCGKQIRSLFNGSRLKVGNVPFAARSSTRQSFDGELMRLQVVLMKCFGTFKGV